MPTLSIANFKWGLETRRSELTAQPGTLVRCENAHVNQGGEVEKRRAFEAFADCAINDQTGQLGVFGLEATSSGLYVFGSAYVYGTGGQTHVLASAIPAGVTYQQLRHPSMLAGEAYVAGFRMTEVVASTNYGGKAFVVAKFADGKTYCYYDGTVVAEIVEGKVLTGLLDGDDQATACQAALARVLTDYAIAVDGTNANQVNVRSPIDETFSLESTTNVGAGGTINVSPGLADDGTPGRGAYARFTITGVSGTPASVSQIEAPDAVSGWIPLMVNTVGWTNVNDTATAIAQEINRAANSLGYTADASSGVVTIFAPTSLAAAYINAGQIRITHTNMTFSDTGTPALKVMLSAYAVGQEASVNGTVLVTSSPPVTGYPSGGTPGYSYQWMVWKDGAWVASAVTDDVYATAPLAATSSFASMVAYDTMKTALFCLRVEDAMSVEADSAALSVVLSNVRIERPPTGRYIP